MLFNAINAYLTVTQAVGSIVWAFRRLRNPKSREMSARSYAFLTHTPNFLFKLQISTNVTTTLRSVRVALNVSTSSVDTCVAVVPAKLTSKAKAAEVITVQVLRIVA